MITLSLFKLYDTYTCVRSRKEFKNSAEFCLFCMTKTTDPKEFLLRLGTGDVVHNSGPIVQLILSSLVDCCY